MSSNYNISGEDAGPNVTNQRPLRQPMPETEAKLLNGTPGQDRSKGRPILGAQSTLHQNPSTLPTSQSGYPNQNQNQNQAIGAQTRSSGLSANAPEFVPGQAYPFALSATATEFVPRSQQFSSTAQPQYNVPMTPAEMEEYETEERLFEQFQRLVSVRPPHLTSTTTVSSSGAIELIKSTIHHLTTNPGQVDSYMSSVVDQLSQQNLDDVTVNKIIEVLIEQGISEPNFRYTGAKICQYLSKHLKLSNQPAFRPTFLKRFQEEFKKKDEWIKDPNQHHRICGLTMFLGELFLNMEIEGANGMVLKFAPLRMALKELLLTMLSNVTDSTVKTACQLLKLSGAAIQDTENINSDQGPQAGYDDVFRRLKEISQDPNLGQTPRSLISSVLSLKDTNWGRKESTSSDASQDPASAWDGMNYLNEPVFYNEHGQTISREQAGFYGDEVEDDFVDYAFNSGDISYPTWANDDTDYGPYSFDLSCNVFGAEGDMDEEMEAAYEEFLRSQVQS